MVTLKITPHERVLTFKDKVFSCTIKGFDTQVQEQYPEWLMGDVEDALEAVSWSDDEEEILQALKTLWVYDNHTHLLVKL